MSEVGNAIYIKQVLQSFGWYKNAIRGIIANACDESTVNPYSVQHTNYGIGPGRGLWQWTLGSNVSTATVENWFASSRKNAIKKECEYLRDHTGQWVDYPNVCITPGMTWHEYIYNTRHYSGNQETVAFLQHWERAAVSSTGHGDARYIMLTQLEAQSKLLRNYSGKYKHAIPNDKPSKKRHGSDTKNSSSGSSNNDFETQLQNDARELVEAINKKIQELTQFDIHNIADTNYYRNGFLTLERTYNNTYKVRVLPGFTSEISKLSKAMIGAKPQASSNGGGHSSSRAHPQGTGKRAGKGWIFPKKGYARNFESGQLFGNTRYGTKYPPYHDGVDLGNAMFPNPAIYACHSGTVIYAGYPFLNDTGLGAGIVLKTNNGWNIVYQEFAPNTSGILVKVGQKVKKGQHIANLVSPNFHVHVGITKMNYLQAERYAFTNNGVWKNPLNFFNKYRWS